jgi:hypothetical protein
VGRGEDIKDFSGESMMRTVGPKGVADSAKEFVTSKGKTDVANTTATSSEKIAQGTQATAENVARIHGKSAENVANISSEGRIEAATQRASASQIMSDQALYQKTKAEVARNPTNLGLDEKKMLAKVNAEMQGNYPAVYDRIKQDRARFESPTTEKPKVEDNLPGVLSPRSAVSGLGGLAESAISPATNTLGVGKILNSYLNPFAGEASTEGPTNPLTRSLSEWLYGATGGPQPPTPPNAAPSIDPTAAPPPSPPGVSVGPQSNLDAASWEPTSIASNDNSNQWDEEEKKRQLLAMLSEGNINPYLQDYSQEMNQWG